LRARQAKSRKRAPLLSFRVAFVRSE
jgi:hypothetical protein